MKHVNSLEDTRCTCGIKSRIAIPKAATNKKKALSTSKSDLHLRKKPVKHSFAWC